MDKKEHVKLAEQNINTSIINVEDNDISLHKKKKRGRKSKVFTLNLAEQNINTPIINVEENDILDLSHISLQKKNKGGRKIKDNDFEIKILKMDYEQKLKDVVEYYEKKINLNDINTMKNNTIKNEILFDDDTPNIELKDILTKNRKVKKSFEPDYYVYTDGACSNNGKDNALAGIGIYFGKNDDRNVSKRIEGKQSNNTAELSAIIETYNIIENDILSGKKIGIVTDSQYAMLCLTTYGERLQNDKWSKNIPNKELVKTGYQLFADNPNIKFIHIKAHTDNTDVHSIGNSYADKLANEAIKVVDSPKKQENFQITDGEIIYIDDIEYFLINNLIYKINYITGNLYGNLNKSTNKVIKNTNLNKDEIIHQASLGEIILIKNNKYFIIDDLIYTPG